MDLRRLIGVNIATLAVLSALMVGMGKDSPVPPLATALAAAVAMWLTDVTGRLSLSRSTINTLLVLIAAFTIWKFALSRQAADLLVFIDAFAYLQIVLFFEKKTVRTWWDLICLSLIQVLLSAQLREGPMFGLILAAYLFFGLSVLALMLLYRERAGLGSLTVAKPAPATSVNWPRLGKVALVTLAVGPLSLFFRFQEPGDPSNQPRTAGPAPTFVRWPWLGQVSSCVGSPPCLGFTPAAGRVFWRQVIVMTLICLVTSAVFFCVIPRGGRVQFGFPRLGGRVLQSSEGGVRRSVGFSDSVQLGELGTIIEDPKRVLEVRLTHYGSGQRYPVRGNVYLRGAMLNQYEAGQWQYRSTGGRVRVDQVGVEISPHTEGLVRQKITIEPMDQEVFCIWPFVASANSMNIYFYRDKERLVREREMNHSTSHFQLGTTAFVDGVQADLAPCQKRVAPQQLLQWPSHALPGLAALAHQWVAESAIAEDDPVGRARLLESKLADSGLFFYTLEGQQRAPGLDPIEDFVTNNRLGHCEYFATALTLMLRSQGIPARMLVGYKCDEYSYSTDTYRVRQSHAHTWVEAYVPPDKVPQEARSRLGFSNRSRGGWLRLDPTPRSSAGVAVVDLVAHGVEDWLEWFRSVWRNDVLGMDSFRQRERIYGPIAERLSETSVRLVSFHWWRDSFANLFRNWTTPPAKPTGNALRAYSIPLFLLLTAVLLWRTRRRFSSLLEKLIPRRMPANPVGKRGRRADVRFYRRLELLLARFDLTRHASQTQREFARRAGEALAQRTGRPQLGDLPPRVAEAFYRVRFGDDDLDGPQAAVVTQALQQIEAAINGDGRPA